MTSLCPIDRDAQNLLEAASSGAALSVKVVTNIAANLIAFLAVLDFINDALSDADIAETIAVAEEAFSVVRGRHPL